MSSKAKLMFASSCVAMVMTIYAVHFQQQSERDRMYQGVLRDEERRREKQKQRQADFDASQKTRELLERTQKVSANES